MFSDARKSGRSQEIRLRPPPQSFPNLSTSLEAVDYSPQNVRLLLSQPSSVLVAWDHPINSSYVEVFPYLVICYDIT